MARTLFTQTAVPLTGIGGIDILANAEHPDVVNGNKYPHDSKTFFAVLNSHEDKKVTFQPVTQKTVLEDGEDLAVANPPAEDINPGEFRIFGPYSAANFRKAADGMIEFNWTLEGGGDIAASDVSFAAVKHP